MDETPTRNSRRTIVEAVERFLAGDKTAFDGAFYVALYSRGEAILSKWIASPHIRSDILQEAILRKRRRRTTTPSCGTCDGIILKSSAWTRSAWRRIHLIRNKRWISLALRGTPIRLR